MPIVQSSFAERYGIVLQELGAQAVKRCHGSQQSGTTLRHGNADAHNPRDEAMQGTDVELTDLIVPEFNLEGAAFDFGEMYTNASPSSWLAELTSWGQFESLVGSS